MSDVSFLGQYKSVILSQGIPVWEKCTYIPVLSNLKGVVDAIVGLVKTIIGTACVVVGGVGFAFLNALVPNNRVIRFPVILVDNGIVMIMDVPSRISRAFIQQIPFLGNAYLVTRDIKQHRYAQI